MTDSTRKYSVSSTMEPAEVSMWLDSYNDIFSDFDPRPFQERMLSDDFISEARKACKEKKGGIRTFNLLLPAAIRNEQDEKRITSRLSAYFKHAYRQQYAKALEIKKKGLYFIGSGITLMLVASYVSFLKSEKYYVHILLVLFEPAGWFMLWAGLDHLVYTAQQLKEDLKFYTAMAHSQLVFVSY
ncbi:MAG: hypothetical protein JNM78_13095 [Cyclobacteriaceae bacterium]|nr:hypothetical protein [Cyclobacteriaceae bacterium]